MSKLVTTRAPVVMGAVIANGINATTNIGAPSLVVNGAPGSNAGNAYGVSGGPGGSAVGYNNGDGVDRRFATYATGGAGGAGASGASSSTGVGGPAGAGGASFRILRRPQLLSPCLMGFARLHGLSIDDNLVRMSWRDRDPGAGCCWISTAKYS